MDKQGSSVYTYTVKLNIVYVCAYMCIHLSTELCVFLSMIVQMYKYTNKVKKKSSIIIYWCKDYFLVNNFSHKITSCMSNVQIPSAFTSNWLKSYSKQGETWLPTYPRISTMKFCHIRMTACCLPDRYSHKIWSKSPCVLWEKHLTDKWTDL